jgi:diguanylate cyclase (GGDEF)-like protein
MAAKIKYRPAMIAALVVAATTAVAAGPLQLRGPAPDIALAVIAAPPDPGDTAAIAAAPGAPLPDLTALRGDVVVWLRLTVTDRAADAARWIVLPDRGWQHVTLFAPGAAPTSTGVAVGLGDRPIAEGRPALPLPPGTTTAVLRFAGDLDGWEPPAGFLDGVAADDDYLTRAQRGELLLGVYAGLLLAVTFVNVLFGRILRDRLFIDYVLYAIPYASIWLCHDWVFTELLWPAYPVIDKYLLFVAIAAAIVLGNRFTIRFLDLERQLPALRRALLAIDAAVAVAVAMAVTTWWRPVPYLLGVTALVTCGTYLVAGAVLSLRGHRYGRYFLLATGTLAIGTVLYTLHSFGILPASPLFEYSAQIGSAAEMLLLALALADRVRAADRDRRAAEARLREDLERAVALRTAELATSNRRLTDANVRLEALSLTDALTGIANRRRFEIALDDEHRRAVRDGTPLTVMLVDVDLFKAYNDEHGHQAGDDCLRQVAAVLADGTRRAGDVLARYGGEEFVLVLPGMGLDVAAGHAERLREAVAAVGIVHPRSDVADHITVSVGVAVLHGDDVDTDARWLVARADDALYRAKRQGRNRVEIAAALTSAPDAAAPAI